MRARATISHRTPHRLRLHIPNYKRNVSYFARLRDELSKCAGVEFVKANPQTASVLIHHRSTAEKIGKFADEMQLFSLALEDTPPNPQSLAGLVNRRVGLLNENLSMLTKGSLDLTSVSAIALVGMGLFKSIRCRDFLPSGANMFWWAVSLLARDYQASAPKDSDERRTRREPPARPPRRITRPTRG